MRGTNSNKETMRDAWQRATDEDILSAIQNSEELEAEALMIVRDEAIKRSLNLDGSIDAASNSNTLSTTQKYLDKCQSILYSPRCRFCLVGIVGMIYPLSVHLLRSTLTDAHVLLPNLVSILICGSLFILFGWFANRWRAILLESLIGSFCLLVTGFLLSTSNGMVLARPLLYLLAIPTGLALAFGIILGFQSIGFYLRKRFNPRYPPGACQTCGYCLFGLIETRFPECGTAFILNEQEVGIEPVNEDQH